MTKDFSHQDLRGKSFKGQDLIGADLEFGQQERREFLLRDALGQGVDAELVLIDCPPGLGLLTLNGLGAARTARVQTLKAESTVATNTIKDPERIVPVSSTLKAPGEHIQYTVPAYAIQVIEFDRK